MGFLRLPKSGALEFDDASLDVDLAHPPICLQLECKPENPIQVPANLLLRTVAGVWLCPAGHLACVQMG